MEKTVKLLVGFIIASVLICACAVVSFADQTMSYNEAQNAIGQLQAYAKEYKEANKVLVSENRLVMNYIRSGAYNGTVWTLAAGKVNDGFVKYVNDKNVDNVKKLRNNQLFVTITDGVALDLPHMCAAMECYTNGVKNFGGWYGDLAQIMVQIAKKEGTTYSVKKSYEEAKKLIYAEGSLFNKEDMVSDLAAIDIMHMLKKEYAETVSEAFYKLHYIVDAFTNGKANKAEITCSLLCNGFLSNCLKLDSDVSYAQISAKLALITIKDAALVTALGALDKQRISSAVRIGSRLAFAEFIYKQVNGIEGDSQMPSDFLKVMARGQLDANMTVNNEELAS